MKMPRELIAKAILWVNESRAMYMSNFNTILVKHKCV